MIHFIELTLSEGRRLSVRPANVNAFWEVEVKTEATGGLPGQPRTEGKTEMKTQIEVSSPDGTPFTVQETYDEVNRLVLSRYEDEGEI